MIDRGLPIAIVGAGLGGLCAALALQRAGFRPVVFEQAPVLGEVGAGISVTPNATKGLEFLGLGEALAATAQMPPLQIVRDAATDAELLRIDRSDGGARYGAAYYMMHRAELHAMLVTAVRAADPDAIRTGHALGAITVDEAGVRLDFAGRPCATAAIVVAADGARSLVRTTLLGDETPQFTGHVAWRLLVPAEAAPAGANAPGSVVWTGEQRSFVRYPVRGGALINCVGLTRSGGWAAEGWSQSVAADEMAAEFSGFPEAVTALIAAAPDGMVGRWGLFLRPPVERMVAGPVALLGDAAHPMLPFMGQGAAMAIEDGVVLGRCLALAASPGEALARYEAARLTRCRMVQAESAAGADRLQRGDGDGKRLARNEDSLGIFDYDPARVAV